MKKDTINESEAMQEGLERFLQKQKECRKNLGKYHSIHRRKTFSESKSEENGSGSYQQSQISRIQLLQAQRQMQIQSTSKVSSKNEKQNQRAHGQKQWHEQY